MELITNNISLIILISALCVLTFALYQVYIQLTGKNIFKSDLTNYLDKAEQQKLFNKSLEFRYRHLIYKIIDFKSKFGLFFASKYTVEDVNIILERTYKKLTNNTTHYMNYYEFDSINTLLSGIVLIIGLPAFFILSGILKTACVVIILLLLFYINVLRLSILRMVIAQQNETLIACFGDFYLCQHHILLLEHKNPLSKGLNIYKYKTTDPFMIQWVTNTLSLINQISEAQVIEKYLILYKDVYVLCQLLNIEKQLIYGGDCSLQLKGLRDVIIQKKQLAIEEGSQKIVNKALLVRNIVFAILIQVGIGAIVLYFLYNKGGF